MLKIRLIDFGYSRLLPPNQKFTKQLGCEMYFAPEKFNDAQYDEKVDIWSATVCIYVLLVGELPFFGNDDFEVEKEVLSKNLDFQNASLYRNLSS